MAAKQYEPSTPDPGAQARMEAWAEQVLGVLRKVAERQTLELTTITGRPLTGKALEAVDSFRDLDKRLETMKAP